MSKKRSNKGEVNKEENNMNEEQVTMPAVEEMDELKKRLKEKEETEDMYLEQLKRLKAEFENYRKRMIKQTADSQRCGEKNLVHDLLVVIDNLQRALDYKNVDFQGLELIKKEFFSILNKKGLKLMEAEGKKFDHHMHHAVGFTEVEDESVESEEIIEVIQQGYFWNDEVLRPAMVIVAKQKEIDEKKTENDEDMEDKETVVEKETET